MGECSFIIMSKQCYGSCFDGMNLFLCKHIKIKHDVLQLCSRESIQLVNRVKISLIMNTFLRIANSIESLKLYFFEDFVLKQSSLEI